jgi:hypothetical protein
MISSDCDCLLEMTVTHGHLKVALQPIKVGLHPQLNQVLRLLSMMVHLVSHLGHNFQVIH